MKIVKNILFILFLLCVTNAWGEDGLQIKGKIRVIKPAALQVKDLNGNTILSCTINTDGFFSTGKKDIVPDVYTLSIGDMTHNIYLENNPITINGYFDAIKPENTSLSFTGIDPFLTLQEYIPEDNQRQKKKISPSVQGKLTPEMAAALAYLVNTEDYSSNKMLLDMIPEQARNSLSAQWLVKRMNTLSRYIPGAQCPDFTFEDANGQKVSLKDFRGKIVVLDFCASWCAPCRKEMRSLLKIYNELKGDDLEFISISLDSEEKNWRKMLEEEKLPWIMLWDKEGFPKNNQPNQIQAAYGFFSIPFLVVIDKEGKLLARKIRGEQVRKAILEARK